MTFSQEEIDLCLLAFASPTPLFRRYEDVETALKGKIGVEGEVELERNEKILIIRLLSFFARENADRTEDVRTLRDKFR